MILQATARARNDKTSHGVGVFNQIHLLDIMVTLSAHPLLLHMR
jgi:hypothetical protein